MTVPVERHGNHLSLNRKSLIKEPTSLADKDEYACNLDQVKFIESWVNEHNDFADRLPNLLAKDGTALDLSSQPGQVIIFGQKTSRGPHGNYRRGSFDVDIAAEGNEYRAELKGNISEGRKGSGLRASWFHQFFSQDGSWKAEFKEGRDDAYATHVSYNAQQGTLTYVRANPSVDSGLSG